MGRLLGVLAVVVVAGFGPVAAQDRPEIIGAKVSATDVTAPTITVFAAASLRNVLDEVAAGYGAARVVVSYGASATMARQISFGAPADIVVLAHPDWMDWMDQQGAIQAKTRVDLMGNRLVLVAPIARADMIEISADGMSRWLGDGRLAIGQIGAVPAGIYGKQWLVSAGLWGTVSPRLAEGENVRAALGFVARGQVPLGVVYHSDAVADNRVRIVYSVPANTHDAIVYPGALTARAGPRAADFLQHLRGDDVDNVFLKHGFTLLRSGK